MSDPKAEALAKQLKDALVQRRPKPWKLVIATLVGGTLGLMLLALWMYPRPRPAPLQIMAFDVVCTPGQTPTVRAQLVAPGDEKMTRRWSGHKIVFQEPRLLAPAGEKPRDIEVKSDVHGQASIDWPLRQPITTDFLALHIDADSGQASAPDMARIFVWPKDAPLLLVDVEEMLIADELDAKASATLLTAAKEGWRMIYLAPASADAIAFGKARRSLGKHQGKLPIGPVLGRRDYATEQTSADALRDLLKDLRGRFEGSMLAVVTNADTALVCKETGLRTVLVGAGAAPGGVVQAPTWADVPIKLK